MPRLARLDYPGALHHAMMRGLERRNIFLDDLDRAAFVSRLGALAKETGTIVYAWALMPNHVHLLIRSAPCGLSRVMQRLLGGYAGEFNRRHRRSGHFFQNRFRSILVEEERYFTELVRYIHLNPVRAGIVGDLAELDRYCWTGHSRLMGMTGAPWQDVDFVLSQFGAKVGRARLQYREFVAEGWAQGRRKDLEGGGLRRSLGEGWASLSHLRRGRERWAADERILGSGEFVESVLASQVEGSLRETVDPADLGELIRRVAALCDVAVDAIRSRRKTRPLPQARALVSYVAVDVCGYSLAEVARNLRVATSSVMRAARRGQPLAERLGIDVIRLSSRTRE